MRNAVAIGMTVLLAACELAPTHRRPDLPTEAAYPADYSDDVNVGTRPPAIPWHEFFVDPRLQGLVASALEHNRDLLANVARIDEARGLYRVQRADRFPTIRVDAVGTRNRIGAGSASSSDVGLDTGAGTGGSVTATGPTTVERYSVAAGTSAFELDFWGRVRDLSTAARAEYLGTVQAMRAFQLSLLRDVATAYLDVLEANERIRLAEATVESREHGLRIAQRRREAGVTSALEFHQAESLLTQAQTDLAAARLTKAQADTFLINLIGGRVPQNLPDALPLGQQTSGTALAAGLPSELMESRPDILAAEEQLRAARANIGAARAAFFPSITLTGSYGYASTDLDNLVGEDQLSWSFGPTLRFPIFDFGRNKGNLSVARARENIAVANYERTIQTAFKEVADALAGRRYLADQVAAQERGTTAQRRIADLAQKRYREGVVSYLEVLDAERSLFSAEQALLQVRRAEAANLVALYVALGGGQ
ncbi:MAG: efflux transporter outer membrane subunit [Steroidobacteraceae bacterium]